MSGPSFWEFLLICMIGLIVLGPKRLPQVANQLGTWIGQARRMTRTLKRQLEEELELDKPLNPPRPAVRHAPPRDDDSYSPLHKQPALTTAAAAPAKEHAVANGGVATAAGGTSTGAADAATPAADPADGAGADSETGTAGADSDERQNA